MNYDSIITWLHIYPEILFSAILVLQNVILIDFYKLTLGLFVQQSTAKVIFYMVGCIVRGHT